MANKDAAESENAEKLDYDMARVVQSASLDYLVEERMRCHKAVEAVSKQPFLRYMDVRKKVR